MPKSNCYGVNQLLLLMALMVLLKGVSAISESEENKSECGNGSLPCFEDCCMRGDWFCHEKEERCVQCSHKASLCGTDREPKGCELYCYKLMETAKCAPSGIYLPLEIIIAGIISSGFVGVLLTVIVIAGCTRRHRCTGLGVCAHTPPRSESQAGARSDDVDLKQSLLCKEHPKSSSLPLSVTSSNETIKSREQREMRVISREMGDSEDNVAGTSAGDAVASSALTTLPSASGASDVTLSAPAAAGSGQTLINGQLAGSDNPTSTTDDHFHAHENIADCHSACTAVAHTSFNGQFSFSSVPATSDHGVQPVPIHTGMSGPRTKTYHLMQ